jgi:hypothetical protein
MGDTTILFFKVSFRKVMGENRFILINFNILK